MMLLLPSAAIAALIYHTVTATISASRRQERTALHASALRATDLEQWRSLDY